jgi:hypothetical protein
MMADAFEVMRGIGVHPAYWYNVWQDVADYLFENGMLEATPLDRLRVSVIRFVGRILSIVNKSLRRN